VKPIQICQILGPKRVDAYYDLLSAQEIRAVLKAGGSHTNSPSTAFTQAARRKVWRNRFDAELAAGNDNLALALLVEWLMRHNRQMLIDYLDSLGIKHTNGETDEDFCETRMPEVLREKIAPLMAKYDPEKVATYLLLIGVLQDTPIYDQTPEVLVGLGMSQEDAAAYVEEHKRTWKKSAQRSA
jgi:hypothetical protein